MFNQIETLQKEVLKRQRLLSGPPRKEDSQGFDTNNAQTDALDQIEVKPDRITATNTDLILDSVSLAIDATPGSKLALEILYLEKLLYFLDTKFGPIKQKMDNLALSNNITFDLLWCLFPEGREITFKEKTSGLTCAGKVVSL